MVYTISIESRKWLEGSNVLDARILDLSNDQENLFVETNEKETNMHIHDDVQEVTQKRGRSTT